MTVKPISTDADHAAALARIDDLWGAPDGSPELDELGVLTVLVDAYESRRWPITAPDPIEAILATMADSGLTRRDLVPLIGKPNRVAEILGRTRRLSLAMIRRIHAELRIPLEVLVQEYPLRDDISANDSAALAPAG